MACILPVGLFAGADVGGLASFTAEAYIYVGVRFRAKAELDFRHPTPLSAIDCQDFPVYCEPRCKVEHDMQVPMVVMAHTLNKSSVVCHSVYAAETHESQVVD